MGWCVFCMQTLLHKSNILGQGYEPILRVKSGQTFHKGNLILLSTNCVFGQSYFHKVGHLPKSEQSKRRREPQNIYSYIAMSQLCETKILKLWIWYTRFIINNIYPNFQKKNIFFNNFRTDMLKMVPIKFHSKWMRNVREISNYLPKCKYKLVIFV
jgi:hypothetical protein